MKLQIEVDDQGKIVDARFKTFGCGSAIASSSLATEWVKGKTVNKYFLLFFLYILLSGSLGSLEKYKIVFNNFSNLNRSVSQSFSTTYSNLNRYETNLFVFRCHSFLCFLNK
ncbi:hypothetical protein AMECASPLE_038874 [Ameca splendens]|uniref:NIF system FeS cluster assembly NifU N-terminal domain-containing protein n=1 Tax=Ameca splendens TaxID=208324 RepID=A0ABV0XLF3_9TELE